MLRHVLLLLAAVVLALPANQISGAVPPPAPPAQLVHVESLTHSARAPLRVGQRITVTLRGSTGGSAVFHILGVAAGIRMREIRSAAYLPTSTIYTGTYIIRPGDVARNAAVFATLAARGTEVTASSERPVTIDTRPPVTTSRQPKPGARIANIRPNIAIDILDLETGVNPATVRLVVNGRNVTARASISETSIAYNPDTPFPPGPVRVQVTAADRARNTLQNEWTVQIVPPTELIRSVTINPASALTRDEVLTVVMTGAPGGKASFAIQGIRGGAPMTESQTPGVYFGTLPVRPEHNVVDAPLFVTLERNGRKSTAPAAALVTILPGPPAAPRITSHALSSANPARGRIALSGDAGPGFRILGRITYEVRSENIEAQGGALGEFAAVAGPDGRWQVSVGPLVPLERVRVILTVTAIDPAGQRSPPATLELTP